MSGVPTFHLPDTLMRSWPKPLLNAGFEVILDPEGKYTNREGEVEKYNTGIVEWEGLKVALAPQEGFNSIRFLFGYVGRENAPLLDNVERLLFASGARVSAITPSVACKRMFLCSPQVVQEWLTNVGALGFQFDRAVLPRRYVKEWSVTKPSDYSGTLRGARGEVYVYMGTSLDDKGNPVEYVALDCYQSLFGRSRETLVCLQEAESFLIGRGAQPIDITFTDETETPPRRSPSNSRSRPPSSQHAQDNVWPPPPSF